jgi:hypothetical protein
MIRVNPRDVAICTVHGNTPYYDEVLGREYPWPALQIARLRRHTPPGYTVLAYGNRLMKEHEDYLKACPEVVYFSSDEVPNGTHFHVWPIRNWLTRVAIKRYRWIVHLDSDAFPIADDWLEHYCSLLSRACPVVAVERVGHPSADRCFLMFSRAGFRAHAFDFTKMGVVDAGAAISQDLEEKGLSWHPLRRTNRVNYHKDTAGIFDDRIYHHAAGSRSPNLGRWHEGKTTARVDDLTHLVLMDWLFKRHDSFIRELRGEEPPRDLNSAVEKAESVVPPLDATGDSRGYDETVSAVKRIANAHLPQGATVAVISKGDPHLLDMRAREVVHFPHDGTGAYTGSYPLDDAEAVAQVEALRARGTEFLIIPRTAFWWLDHYQGLRTHLQSCSTRMWQSADCEIYRFAAPISERHQVPEAR